jgi:gamma-glutamyltranspeptidase / glutathione hydrolase
MGKKKRAKKCFQVLGIGSVFIGLAIGLDMAISGNVLHPLMYLYSPLSWVGCKASPSALACKEEAALASRLTISGNQGAVVTTQYQASRAGLEILKQGGNAIDAAVAVGYALAVTDPCCGNIGGGGFMTIRLANGQATFINFREKAPLAASQDMYLDEQGEVISGRSTKGYLAVGVPGTVKGLDYALGKYGNLKRWQVMVPAIKLAEEGFVLQKGDIQILKFGTKQFRSQPNVSQIFLKNGEKEYQVGDRLVQKELATTLKLVAQQGPDAFYKGAITNKIVEASRKNGGILTKQDFSNYSVSETKPLRCTYRGYEVLTAPLPGGGTTLCQMLNILEGYPLSKLGWHTKDSLHPMLSAMVFAFADRNRHLGDPAFVKSPVEKLVSKDYAAQLRSQIPQNRAIPPKPLYEGITTQPEGTNTTHFSVVDSQGNAVALTYTINGYFGAGVIAENTGFFLNNEMDDFTAKPGKANQFGLVQGAANAIAPGKQPLSSMTPTIISRNNQLFAVTGSPGGPTIPTTVLQVLTNVIDYKMPISKAVNAPRLHYQGLPNFVFSEPYAVESDALQNLWSMDYRVIPLIPWGAAESILIDADNQLLKGGHDNRKPAGAAVAY